MAILILFYLLFFPKEAFLASKEGLLLWFHTLLPSLLPFMILSDFLIHTGLIPKVLGKFSRFFLKIFGLSSYGAYAFLIGMLCGYPMGAKLTADLYREEKIDFSEASYLLTFCNNPSPMFLISYVLLNTLKKPSYAPLTMGILFTSSMISSFFFRIFFRRFSVSEKKELAISHVSDSFFSLWNEAILNGMDTITRLGGYLIMFSIGSSMIKKVTSFLGVDTIFLPCILELTTGIQLLANTSLPLSQKYLWMITLCSFGGISTMIQTKGMLQSTPLSVHLYAISKTLQGAITWLIIRVLLFVTKIF